MTAAKCLTLACAVALLAGCGTGFHPTAAAPSALSLEAAARKQATAAGKVTAKDQALAAKIIDADFIDKNFEKAPGGGYWIPNPSEEGDGVIVKKVSSGFKNFKFTPGATPGLLNWTAMQTCLGQDMEEWTQHVTGTVDLGKKVVTYQFGK